MPKEPKRKMSAKIGQSTRHAPLGQVIQDDANRDKYASMKKLARNIKDDEETTEELLDVKSSKRILELSREQMREVEEERVARQQRQSGKRNDVSRDSSDEEDSMNDNDEDDDDDYLVQHDEGYVSMSNTGLTPEEEALLSNMVYNNFDQD
jgi:essential nuclear protein 1